MENIHFTISLDLQNYGVFYLHWKNINKHGIHKYNKRWVLKFEECGHSIKIRLETNLETSNEKNDETTNCTDTALAQFVRMHDNIITESDCKVIRKVFDSHLHFSPFQNVFFTAFVIIFSRS